MLPVGQGYCFFLESFATPWFRRPKLDDDQNVDDQKWMTTKMEEDNNGKRPKW